MIGYSRACGSYHDFLAANTEATETRVPFGEGEVSVVSFISGLMGYMRSI
jgi:hypothetical protein